MAIPHQTAESFWARTARIGPCLEWTGARRMAGYGVLRWAGDNWSAHRLAWTLTYGPIPMGLQVLHTCDNRRCVDPLHLFLGTHQDNMRDATAKGRDHLRARYGEANHSATLTEDQVRRIRALASQGVSRRVLGRQFGLTHQTVTKIVLRQRWSSVA